MWGLTAMSIGEKAWDTFGNNRRGAEEFIKEAVSKCEDVILIPNIYELVSWIRLHNSQLFFKAVSKLDKVNKNDFDATIAGIAFWIVYETAFEHYHKCFAAQKKVSWNY